MINEAQKNRFGRDRISHRQIDELIGIARGITADNIVSTLEAEFLEKWLAANAEICEEPLLNALYWQISDMLRDGILDDEEKADLFDTLQSLIGNDFEIGESLPSSNLPLCDPAPEVVFAERVFSFTGTFIHGTRKECENTVEKKGAQSIPLGLKTDFLVIGAYATESWKHSTFGNKILKAVTWRDEGKPISIISEEHWSTALTLTD